MNESYLSGGNRIKLYCQDNGNKNKPAILFIHGWSQTHESWNKQFNSHLNDDFHLILFDLRGHGYSEQPIDEHEYTNSQLYADDIHAMIIHYGLEQFVLVGWSSGSLVIADYLRHYGNGNVAGIVMTCGLHGLGIEELTGMLGAGPSEYMADAMSNNFETQYKAMLKCTRDMAVNIDTESLQIMTAQSMMTSPYVRKAMMARVVDDTDVLTDFNKPALVIQGRHDPFILLEAAKHMQGLLSNSKLSIYENSAHMPFWEEPEKYNQELDQFVRQVFEME